MADLIEVRLQTKSGPAVLAFDGRVLEYFGDHHGGESRRFHLSIIDGIQVAEPDKKGHVECMVITGQPPQRALALTIVEPAGVAELFELRTAIAQARGQHRARD